MLSYIIPTRDRPEHLALTLSAIGRLPADALERAGGAEAVVIDNASRFPPTPPARLANGTPVRLLYYGGNGAAASRNVAASHASGDWLVMLDDDSHPDDGAFIDDLLDAPPNTGAVGAEVRLASGAREAGGLPEVFIGCGVAIRRSLFTDPHLADPAGRLFNGSGYDPSFGYYAEEYDFVARLLLAGYRVAHSRRFRVTHHKSPAGRDMNAIIRNLVRNNAWVEQRYAPEPLRRRAIDRVLTRYRAIADKESARDGYHAGLRDLEATLDTQPRAEMPPDVYERFTGIAAARSWLREAAGRHGFRRAALVARGKNDWVIERVLEELGVDVVIDERDAEALVIGTLSPGPMLDAGDAYSRSLVPVVAPWNIPAYLGAYGKKTPSGEAAGRT